MLAADGSDHKIMFQVVSTSRPLYIYILTDVSTAPVADFGAIAIAFAIFALGRARAVTRHLGDRTVLFSKKQNNKIPSNSRG